MKNDPTTPKRLESKKVRNNEVTEAMSDRVLLKEMQNDKRMKEASKPIYLTRYE